MWVFIFHVKCSVILIYIILPNIYKCVNTDGVSSSVPEKENHWSLGARRIVKTIYNSLPNKRLKVSGDASQTFDLTKIPLTTVKKITSNSNQEGSV